jgi:hypothetical protein
MLMFLMHKRTSWSDYFTGSAATTYNSETYGTTQTFSGISVHVLDCLFRSIISTYRGGGFYCNSVTYLLVESTSFFSCKTSNQDGGAIFFQNSGSGQCVLHEVCGYDCCSTRPGSSCCQFANIQVNDATSSKNYINYSSFVRCVNMRSDSHHTLGLTCGKICCPSVNISMNRCQYYSAILFQPSSDPNSFTGLFSFTTFSDNTANGHTCIYPWQGGLKIEFKSCNILRNSQGSLSSGGTIYSCEYVMIKDSCILENKATYIFNAYSGTITVSNCTLDSTSKTGSVVIQNTVTKSFINALNHMSTLNCNSEYDSVGYLTPNLQTPSPSKKQMPCFTFMNCFYQPLSFSITFIFNFFYPYASIDL